jgi:hypothetical protein
VIALGPQLIRGASVSRDGKRLFFSYGAEEGDIWLATLPPQR